MIFLILSFFFLFALPIKAAPTINIVDYPASVFVGTTFSISFNVINAAIGSTYHYKIVGDTATDISIFPPCASKYDDCLNLIITNTENNLATASAKINIQSNLNNLKIRIAIDKSGGHTAYDSSFINIISLDSPKPTAEAVTPTIFNKPLVITEIMANPETGQDEWVEIYNPNNFSLSLKDLCLRDATQSPHCFSDNESIAPLSYYPHSFTSAFLNNSGDTIYFLDQIIIYPKSPKNYTYSRQENNSWCFADSSQGAANNDCSTITSSSTSNDPSPPLLTLQFIPDSISAGDDFNLVFNLNSSDSYSLRLISPFGSQYFPFNNFKDGYSWLTLPLSVPKKLTPGTYPLSFHLKKLGSSHLFDFQLGNLVITAPVSNPKVLGVTTYRQVLSVPTIIINRPVSEPVPVAPSLGFFSWPFFLAGSILFLSPILFPKIYTASSHP